MKLLKILYICWMVFWGLACLLGIFMGHWGYKTSGEILIEMLFLYFALCLFPLLPYFYYLIYAKTRTKNIFVAIFCYCLLFIIICCYLLCFVVMVLNKTEDIIYLIVAIIVHIVTFSIIYMEKGTYDEKRA